MRTASPWLPGLPFLLLLAASAVASATTWSHGDDRVRIAQRLASEGPQEILVQVETALEDAIHAGHQELAARECEARTGLPCAFLVARAYPRVKQRAFCGLDGVTPLQDLASEPRTFVRVETVAAFDALLARPDVALVYETSRLYPPHAVSFWFFSCAFAAGQPDGVWLWGDWDGNGVEEVGKYVAALDAFLLDTNGDGLWQGNAGGDRSVVLASGLGSGEPLVGDWNGDGADEVGKRVDANVVLDANGNGRWDGVVGGDRNTRFAPGTVRGTPLVGDWNGDGRDDLGIYQPYQRFLLDLDGDGLWSGAAGGDRLIPDPLTCGWRGFAADWDLARPGASVGSVQGSTALGGVGWALDLDEDGQFGGAADLEAISGFPIGCLMPAPIPVPPSVPLP